MSKERKTKGGNNWSINEWNL